jgi:adenylate cyclase
LNGSRWISAIGSICRSFSNNRAHQAQYSFCWAGFAFSGRRLFRRQNQIKVKGLYSPLVGREQEWSKLTKAIADLEKHKAGAIVFVLGDAGVGKSRLIGEARDQTQARQSTREKTIWLEGNATANAQNIAYFPVIDLFRNWLDLSNARSAKDQKKYEEQLRDQFSPEVWRDIAPHFKKLLGLELDPVSEERLRFFDAAIAKKQLFYAIRQGVRALAGKNPVVLAIDDLHWADETTIDLLQYLIQLIDEVPILFIFSMRREEDTRAMFIRNWARDSYAPRLLNIVLQPLSKTQSQELLVNLIGKTNLSDGLDNFVNSRAEGNPFHVEEIVRWLLDRGMIVRQNGGWAVAPKLDSLDLPPAPLGVIAARIDRLDPNLKETLQAAAIIGRNFSYGILERVVANPERLDAQLAKLEGLDLISRKQDPRRREYKFKHILTQRAAYEGLSLPSRQEIHGKIARVHEQYGRRRGDDQIGIIAYHYSKSDDASRAVEYAIKSGDKALASYTPDEALKYYEEAFARMDAQGVQDDRQRAQVLLGLGDAESARGDSDAAMSNWKRSLAFFQIQNQFESVASILRRLGSAAWVKGDTANAFKLYEEGLSALDRKPFSEERAALFHEIGRLHFRTGNNAQAVYWAKQALHYAESINAFESISQAYNTLGVATARMGQIKDGVKHVNQALRVALDHDLLGAACRAYTNLGLIYAALDHEKSIQYCREGIALAKRIGDLSYESWIQSALASNWCSLEGDWEQGIAAARASIVIDRVLGQSTHMAVPLIVVAQIYQCHGNGKQSEKHFREAQEIAEKTGDPQLLFPIYDGLAGINLENGNRRAAEEYLEKRRLVVERTGFSADGLLVTPFLN